MNNIPEGFKLVPADASTALEMGFAYLDAAREAQPERNWAFSLPGYRAMLAAAPEAPAPDASEQSNKDYAIEHAEYMAKSADDVLAKFQAYGLALLAVDEGGDDAEGELFEAIDTARSDLQE